MTSSTTLQAPDWLTLRSGTIKPGVHPETHFVLVGDQPLYKLEIRPASGKFACAVSNTVNGKRLDDGTTFSTSQEALKGGLEQLRAKLGW
jgi:hypothetical protein